MSQRYILKTFERRITKPMKNLLKFTEGEYFSLFFYLMYQYYLSLKLAIQMINNQKTRIVYQSIQVAHSCSHHVS